MGFKSGDLRVKYEEAHGILQIDMMNEDMLKSFYVLFSDFLITLKC